MNEARPLHVAVVGPPLEKSGGIGTLFRYAKPHFPPNVDVRFIDTRGFSSSAALSFFPFMRAIFLLTFLRLRGLLDVVHLNFGARGSAARKIPLMLWIEFVLRRPAVMQLHASSFDVFYRSLPTLLQTALRWSLSQASEVLVLGTKWKELFVGEIGLDPGKVTVFVMGVPDLSTPDSTLRQKDKKLVGLFAGELGSRKGSPQLLRALEHPALANISLIMAGRGSLDDVADVKTRLESAQRLDFLGLVSPERVHKELQRVDFLILPSKAEGLPVSVLEGLSAAKVVVATLSGALGEHLIDGLNALVISEATENAIVAALSRLSHMDKISIGHQAHLLWEKKFDAAKTTMRLAEHWQKVAEIDNRDSKQ